MLDDSIQEFAWRMASRVSEIAAQFTQSIDFSYLESVLNEECAALNAALQQTMLQTLLRDETFLERLKRYAAQRGMRLKEYRSIGLTLSNGQRIDVNSPYFVKAKPDKRKRKRGPNGSGAHLALKTLGFMGGVSPGLLSDALQTALLCPSYEVASTVLKGRGIALDVKTLRRLCQLSGDLEPALRGRVALSGKEDLRGYTLVVGVDGGRLRERRRKRGRKAERLSRQGYHTEWREPKLFTLYLLDRTGEVVKAFKPLHDATMGNSDAMFALLERYLRNLGVERLARIVFCGDGATWIWNGAEALCERMGFDNNLVHQVLDYTHAKQNLDEIVELLPPDKQASARARWQYLLWNGRLDELECGIGKAVKGKTKLEKATKKFATYFAGNRKRMRYAEFRAQGLPCGSGHVESAIRRVINLRLKAPGSFWLKGMAEGFLFLRSQLLSGRWEIFIGNLTALTRRAFWPILTAGDNPCELPKAA